MTRASLFAIALIAVSFTSLQGCGSYVSTRESLDTALANPPSYSPPEIYGYVPPAGERVVDMTAQDPSPQSPPQVVVVANPADDGLQPLPTAQSHRSFVANVYREMNDLDRELAWLEARADQKGGAGWAAIDPAARDLRMYRQQIEDTLSDLDPNANWDSQFATRAEVTEFLRAAQQSLANATAEVNSLPSNN